MQLTTFLLPLLSALGSASARASTPPETTTVALRIPPTHLIPNPHTLPASTRATLSTLGKALAAPLSVANTFVFRNVTPGSYLADVHCATHAFVPLRVDVLRAADDAEGGGGAGLRVAAWETYRGNDWGNKGEAVVVVGDTADVGGGGRDRGAGVVMDLRVAGEKGYFMERSKFSVLSIFRNPIILLSLVSMALFFGMPKLVENMDPEMRAEWEERQKENPMNALMGAASGQPANPMSNFDMAAFLAGSSSSKPDEGNGGSGQAKAKGESKKKR
ncbi:hypothetical protein MFIFM68171_03223 [Madurella fahalii]|uniref:ER membrane protein complex subunit 7 beta-sandwich domain-containing protein n=1 Tax=Madurella fahalii TaxID=1157608 RepID=A0ABQ0G5H0_9PEZI